MHLSNKQPTTTSIHILKFCHEINLATMNFDGETSRQGETEEEEDYRDRMEEFEEI